MIYKIIYAKKGYRFTSMGGAFAGNSHKEALQQAQRSIVNKKDWKFVVIGKTVKFFDCKKEIKGETKIFKFDKDGRKYVMLMVGSFVMSYPYPYAATRNKVYKKCLDLESAKTASPAARLKNIIAYLEETLGTSALTSKKTLSGSAVSVTNPDASIPTSIKSGSGMLSAKDMEKLTWKSGYETSPSKSNRYLKAKVKDLSLEDDKWPGINRHMKRMQGQTIYVTKGLGGCFLGHGWHWLPKWLEFPEKLVPDELYNHSWVFAKSLIDGKTMKVKHVGGGWWKQLGTEIRWNEEFLDFHNIEAYGLYTPRGTKGEYFSGGYVSSMSVYTGKKMSLKLYVSKYGMCYVGSWNWDKTWLSERRP